MELALDKIAYMPFAYLVDKVSWNMSTKRLSTTYVYFKLKNSIYFILKWVVAPRDWKNGETEVIKGPQIISL